jgi:hypothetical protein
MPKDVRFPSGIASKQKDEAVCDPRKPIGVSAVAERINQDHKPCLVKRGSPWSRQSLGVWLDFEFAAQFFR